MRTTVLDPIGVEVTDLDVRAVGPDEVADLRGLLAEHGVAILREQDIDDDVFTAFLRRFGTLTFTVGETPLPGHPDLNVVTNVGRSTPPRSSFHVDTSYVSRPPAYTALRAVTIPRRGGETLFTNQYRAYDTLSDDLRVYLAGRRITHVVTGLAPDALGDDAQTEAEHPVFATHPISGRTALYLSTPQRCVAVSGLDAGSSATTVRALYAHSTAEDNVHRHAWRPGDLVMWDNRCVLHRADHDDVDGDRVLHRGMVAAPDPVPETRA